MTKAVVVAACQIRHRPSLDEAMEAAAHALKQAAAAGAALALLPEYWFGGTGAKPEGPPYDLVTRLSKEVPGLVVAGNEIRPSPEGTQNVVVLALDGRVVGQQAKLRPTDVERAGGIVPGARLTPADTAVGRVATLVCADVLFPDLASEAARARPDVTLVPVMSRSRFGDDSLRARTAMFVGRAFDTGSVLVKASGHTEDGKVAGRSLIAAPWGVVAAAARPFEDACLVATLERARLDRFRRQHAAFVEGREPPAPPRG